MRILFTIPHFYRCEPKDARYGACSDPADQRAAALAACVHSLYQHLGPCQSMIHISARRTIAANQARCATIKVLICTSGPHHLLDKAPLDPQLYEHVSTDADPRMLGFECHRTLRQQFGQFDYYGYLEDDLLVRDPWFFAKLVWFNQCVGDSKLLLPNRYERGGGIRDHKVYIDGDLAPEVTQRFQHPGEPPVLESRVMGTPVRFQRPLNPHSGCFFLNAQQMQHWMAQPFFLDHDISFVGPLESAATLGVLRALPIYKPAVENASFLEIEHFGNRFRRLIRYDEPK